MKNNYLVTLVIANPGTGETTQSEFECLEVKFADSFISFEFESQQGDEDGPVVVNTANFPIAHLMQFNIKGLKHV